MFYRKLTPGVMLHRIAGSRPLNSGGSPFDRTPEHRASKRFTWRPILIIAAVLGFFAMSAISARAQSTTGTYQNLIVTSTAAVDELDVTGWLDVQSDYSYFGSLSSTNASAVNFLYTDGAGGVGAEYTSALTRPGAAWSWGWLNGSGGSTTAMELDASSQLILTSTLNSGSIVLDPTSGQISINGQQVLTTADGITVGSSGDIGIGTTDPDSPFEVSTSDAGTNTVAIVVSNTSAGNYAANVVFQNSNGQIGNLSALGAGYDMGYLFGANDFAILAGQGWSASNLVLMTNGGGDIRFGTGGYSTANERMRITSSGNIGIGTTTPQTKLDIASGSQSVDVLTVRQTSSGSGNYYSNLIFKNTNGTIANFSALGAGYSLGDIWGPNDFVLLGGQGNASTNMLFLTNSSGSIKFGTGGYNPSNERMRITPSGNVGINTTTPQAPLEVNGVAMVDGNLMVGGTAAGPVTGSAYFHGSVVVTGTMSGSTVVANGTNAMLVPQQGDLSMGNYLVGPQP